MQERRRHIIAIPDASFGGVGWNHSMAGIVKQQSGQQLVRLAAYDGAVGPLREGLLPDCVIQRAIHDRWLLTRQDLILVFNLPDIEAIAQQVIQGSATERNAAAGRS